MSLIDLMAARWRRSSQPRDHRPREALEAALREIDNFDPHHAIIILAREEEDGRIHWHIKRAGSFGNFAQRGLLAEVSEGWNG